MRDVKRRKSRTALPRPKGASRAAKKGLRSKIKTKAKTATRGTKKSQQKVAMNKAAAPVESPTMSKSNRDIDEAAPSSISDVEANTTSRRSIEAA